MEPIKDEFVSYETDEDGTPIRKHNDLLDGFRYGLYFSSWDPEQIVEEIIPDHIKDNPYLMMAYRQEKQLEDPDLIDDWLCDMEEDFVSYA